MNKLILISTLLLSTAVFAVPKNAKVFFVEPKDGAVVSTKFKVKMGLKGIKLCEANKPPKIKNCGHHHIIVDGNFIPEGQAVPVSESHIHFGKMQTETELTLSPGKHKLTLQFADWAHLSYGEKLSSTINIEVK
jgi:hypothetical protein